MKKLFPIFFSTLPLLAVSPTIYMAPPEATPKALNESLSKGEKTAVAKEAAQKGTSEMMIISPEGRAKDIEAAIAFLKKHAPSTKPSIKLTNGSILSGIINVNVMPGGTLLIIQIASLKGVQYQIEKIENIDTIMTNGT
ncbi:MAG: hypothetical protein KDK71_00530 [Chlamydiia bacterium]|nr:hypothetical protein [Chlamydiia bacterium]